MQNQYVYASVWLYIYIFLLIGKESGPQILTSFWGGIIRPPRGWPLISPPLRTFLSRVMLFKVEPQVKEHGDNNVSRQLTNVKFGGFSSNSPDGLRIWCNNFTVHIGVSDHALTYDVIRLHIKCDNNLISSWWDRSRIMSPEIALDNTLNKTATHFIYGGRSFGMMRKLRPTVEWSINKLKVNATVKLR